MILSESTYLSINIGEVEFPVSAKDMEVFTYSYGMFSLLPALEVKFLDKIFFGLMVYPHLPVNVTFGNTSKDAIAGQYSHVSNTTIEAMGFGHMGAGISSFIMSNTALLPLRTDSTPKAFILGATDTLASIYSQYGVTCDLSDDLELKTVGTATTIYRGIENTVDFLSDLILYTTTTKNTLALSLYFDYLGKGKIISFMDKLNTDEYEETDVSNVLLTAKNVHQVLDTYAASNFRHSLFRDALYTETFGYSYSDNLLKRYGTFEWIKQVPQFKANADDIISYPPYQTQSLHMGIITPFKSRYLDIYSANIAFWQKARASAVEVVIPTLVKDDAEPGELIRMFNTAVGTNGAYVVLQKTFFFNKESGFFTKLYLVQLRGYR